ncbi:MAG: hypothetical protein RJB38_223 [Pseudomonadota bacterium]|jgi:hypothetical protein
MEVLIAMFLLVVISFATYQATTETFKLRDVLSTEGEFYNGIRLALSVFQRDLENATSPIAMQPEQNRPGTPANAGGIGGAAMPPGSMPSTGVSVPGTQSNTEVIASEFFSSEIDRFGIRASRFFGKASEALWLSVGNTRMYRDSRESDFIKIRYRLERETDSEFGSDSSMLVRIASPNAFIYDETRDDQVKRYTLLHGIKKLKFRYYRQDKERWSDSWDTESEDTKGRFPDLVEVDLEVSAPKGLRYEGRYWIRPEVPIYGIPSTL